MRAARGIEGFTLLELLVVSVLIAISLALTIPRVQGLFFNDPLSRSTRVLVSVINEARGIALDSGLGSVLLVDITSGSLTVQPHTDNSGGEITSVNEPPVVKLEAPVTFASVWSHTNGRNSSGIMPILINRRGMVEPAIIELRDTNRVMSLKVSPFIAEVEVFDHTLPPPATLFAETAVNR